MIGNTRNLNFKKIENSILKYLIILYPLLISITRFIPLVGTLLTLLILVVLILNRIYFKKTWFKYSMIIGLFILSTLMYHETYNHQAHIKVLTIFFLSMDCFDTGLYNKIDNIIKDNSKFILFQITIVLSINLLFFITPLGFSIDYSSDWGFSAYRGTFIDPHQAAYQLCILLVFLLLIAKNRYNWTQYLLLLGIEYCILMTGARVPTVLGLVIGIIFCLEHKLLFKANNEFIKRIFSYLPLLVLGTLSLYFIFFYTSFGDKMINSLNSISFDNGRGSLREKDIQFFYASSWLHKFFGNGTDAVILSHAGKYNDAIWSHNDFFQILCGMGIFTILIYCSAWLRVLFKMIKYKSLLGLGIVILCIMVAYFNGLYIHSRFVFIMPLLFQYYAQKKK